jgi:hypothetical protein
VNIKSNFVSKTANQVPFNLKVLEGVLAPSSIRENHVMTQFKLRLSAFFLTVLMVSFLGCASTPGQSGTGEFFDDSVITTKVKAAIFNEPSLSTYEINVETYKGRVQLSGFVGSQAEINKAVEVARSVKGVQSVKNDMRVK